MAKTRKPLFSLNAQGKLGPLVISRLQRGSHKVAVKRPPSNPRSPAQQLIRDYYGSGIETYPTLDETERLYYHNLYPHQRGHRAYLNFMKEWLMAKLPLHWLDHVLSGRDALASPIAPAAHPAYDPSLIAAHNFPFNSRYRLGTYYISPFCTKTANTTPSALLANFLYAIPFPIPTTRTTNSIAIDIQTAVLNKKARLGIYADNGHLYPSTLLLEAPEISIGSTGLIPAAINKQLTPDFYWLVYLSEATPSLFTQNDFFQPIFGGTRAYISYCVLLHTQAYGPLPNPFPTSAPIYTYVAPIIMLRYSS